MLTILELHLKLTYKTITVSMVESLQTFLVISESKIT